MPNFFKQLIKKEIRAGDWSLSLSHFNPLNPLYNAGQILKEIVTKVSTTELSIGEWNIGFKYFNPATPIYTVAHFLNSPYASRFLTLYTVVLFPVLVQAELAKLTKETAGIVFGDNEEYFYLLALDYRKCYYLSFSQKVDEYSLIDFLPLDFLEQLRNCHDSRTHQKKVVKFLETTSMEELLSSRTTRFNFHNRAPTLMSFPMEMYNPAFSSKVVSRLACNLNLRSLNHTVSSFRNQDTDVLVCINQILSQHQLSEKLVPEIEGNNTNLYFFIFTMLCLSFGLGMLTQTRCFYPRASDAKQEYEHLSAGNKLLQEEEKTVTGLRQRI